MEDLEEYHPLGPEIKNSSKAVALRISVPQAFLKKRKLINASSCPSNLFIYGKVQDQSFYCAFVLNVSLCILRSLKYIIT